MNGPGTVYTCNFGPWRSLVARLLGVQEVASSNLAGPTNLSQSFAGDCHGSRKSAVDDFVDVGSSLILVSQDRTTWPRFEREARTPAQLNHLNICTIHDIGEDFLVMEWLQGTQPGMKQSFRQ